MEVIKLSPAEVIYHWRSIEPAIAKAIKCGVGEATTYDYLTWLQEQELYQCWVVQDEKVIVNISLTKINYYATHSSLHLITTTSINGGKWDLYKEAHHELEKFARAKGCRRIEMYGRPGWSRILNRLKGSQDEQYKEVYVVHSMSLENNDEKI